MFKEKMVMKSIRVGSQSTRFGKTKLYVWYNNNIAVAEQDEDAAGAE